MQTQAPLDAQAKKNSFIYAGLWLGVFNLNL